MYVTKIPNRDSPPAILVRESYRVGAKVKTRTLANITKLPPEAIDAVRRTLKGHKLVSLEEEFKVIGSWHHGHIQAVLTAMDRLGLPNLIASRSSRDRDLVLAMVAARILAPGSKLETTRWWHVTTLPSILGIADANENDLYAAMDWLVKRQGSIEKKLASRHLEDGGVALYDLTSSYFEGVTCPLAALGHNRDGKKGKLQVNYGLLTDQRGCAVSLSVFKGNIGDPKTLLPQVAKTREVFGLNRLVLVGDRGMITQKQIRALQDIKGMDWITALRPDAIKKLVEGEAIQMGLFDERNLFELDHPDYVNERLVACRNPDLAKRRAERRKRLLEATVRELEKVQQMVERDKLRGRDPIQVRVDAILSGYKIGKYYQVEVHDEGFDFEVDEKGIAAQAAVYGRGDPELEQRRLVRYKRHMEAIARQLEKLRHRIERGRLYGKDKIGVRVGMVLKKHQVDKHFELDISDDSFSFTINQDKVSAEAALDGIYVVRTSVSEDRLTADDTVRSYKLLSNVERAFLTFKMILKARPIRHRLEDRVRAHLFLCMLAYYVQWHMTQAWRPLLFADEDQVCKATRDPVAPAKRSDAALRKVRSKTLADGTEVHSFHSLLALLTTIVRNECLVSAEGSDAHTFEATTTPSPKQQQVLDLLATIAP